MTIEINKLRQLAQAATPGPWYVGSGIYELYALGYRFNAAPKEEVIETPQQLAKRGFQETLHVAAYPCVGSCGQRCPNHHCNSHNGEPYRPRNMSWEDYVEFARDKGYVFPWGALKKPEVKP